ncbi:hypothetical protein E8F11_28335 [Pseudomonas sp. BN417]|nr:hypothetical protein [Pseudomonas sp. BN417]
MWAEISKGVFQQNRLVPVGYDRQRSAKCGLGLFGYAKDRWQLAYWFASVNSFLGGQRPQDLVATQPERINAAARDELLGVSHG